MAIIRLRSPSVLNTYAKPEFQLVRASAKDNYASRKIVLARVNTNFHSSFEFDNAYVCNSK